MVLVSFSHALHFLICIHWTKPKIQREKQRTISEVKKRGRTEEYLGSSQTQCYNAL